MARDGSVLVEAGDMHIHDSWYSHKEIELADGERLLQVRSQLFD